MSLPLRYSTHVVSKYTHTKTPPHLPRKPFQTLTLVPGTINRRLNLCQIRVSNGPSTPGDSYLDMWKRSVERQRKEEEFKRIVENSSGNVEGSGPVANGEVDQQEIERRSREFEKIQQVPVEVRDRVQRMQVIDRAAAALAAASAVIKEVRTVPPLVKDKVDLAGDRRDDGVGGLGSGGNGDNGWNQNGGKPAAGSSYRQNKTSAVGTPGPDFWSWVPPPDDTSNSERVDYLQRARQTSPDAIQARPVLEKERSQDSLVIPFQSELNQPNITSTSVPPLQSWLDSQKVEAPNTSSEIQSPEQSHEVEFASNAAEAALALEQDAEISSTGRSPDGSRWWKETGIETRTDGVVCKWTLIRGVSVDGAVEWENKYWEAADDYGHKELGSEKSGRDAEGNIWHEYWTESMWQENGMLHMEKTADKWGKKGYDSSEWHEKWYEKYDASGRTDKWAHKWCSIDPTTILDPGHAHVWHERWGERYDGMGGSIKYTDKWAERCEGDGWSKWGDKWDENFNMDSHGVKQGETWWEGTHGGDRWNRTWGEEHNGTGWVHKYGKSSSGEHWDTHQPEDTWYERFPHFGFTHCYENSVRLREVTKPSLEEESSDVDADQTK